MLIQLVSRGHFRVGPLRFLEARLMSQVYESKKDHVEGRGLDSRVGKSCILDSHCELGLVERESLATFLLPSILEPSHVKKKKGSTMCLVAFSSVCLFVSNCYPCFL